MKKLIVLIAFSLFIPAILTAAELGDAARPLDIKEWVKGGPVKLEDGKGKKIYVIEFWATWCGPCRQSIPHLTEMAHEFKDKGVVFVGVTDEASDVVKKFVTKMGDQMDYNVGIDGGKTDLGYMAAYGINGIPHAFVVDQEGKIVWHGHPMDGLKEVVAQVVAGKYDYVAAAAAAKSAATAADTVQNNLPEIQTKVETLTQAIENGKEDATTKKIEDDLVALGDAGKNLFGGHPFNPADFRQHVLYHQKVVKYHDLAVAGTNSAAIAVAEKALDADVPDDVDAKQLKSQLDMAIQIDKAAPDFRSYVTAVSDGGDATKAKALAKNLKGLSITNAAVLNQLALVILTDESIVDRDFDLALKFAQDAVAASEGSNAEIVDTYAGALFSSGKIAEAVQQEKKAISLANDQVNPQNPDALEDMKMKLVTYQAKLKDAAK